MTIIRKTYPIIIVILLSLPAIWPLLLPGFIGTDDGNQMISRLYAFHRTLRSGQFPVRFLEVLNHGYGYPVMNFLYPLPFYIGEIIHLVGINFLNSIKILFLLSFPLSALAMFFWLRDKFSNNLVSLVGSVVYIYAPYRFFDVYKRGSLGEAVAFIFIPAIFLFLDKFLLNGKSKYLSLAAIFYAALITSHNIIAFIFSPVIFLYCLKYQNVPHLFRKVVYFAILSLLISAFFWLPAIYDLKFTRAPEVVISKFQDYFLTPALIFPTLGLSLIFFLLTSVLVFKKASFEIKFFVLVGLMALLLTTSLSQPLWQFSFLPRLVQFPWRFLSIFIFSVSFLVSALFTKSKKVTFTALIIFLAIIFGLTSNPVVRIFYPEAFYLQNDSTTTVKNEYLPIWLKNESLRHQPTDFTLISGSAVIQSNKRITSDNGVELSINRVYFPGWKVSIDGESTPINYQKEGFLDIKIPAGSHEIRYVFQETPLHLMADGLSVLGIILVGGLLFNFPIIKLKYLNVSK